MAAQLEVIGPARPAGRPRVPWAAFACVAWVVGLLGVFIARQPPVGGIRGRLIAEESGRPIPSAELLLAPADPATPGRKRRLSISPEGRFALGRLHAGDYLVSASARAHRLSPTRVTIAEGSTLDLLLELPPISSFLDVYAPQPVFIPGEAVQVTAHGFTRDEELTVAAYRVDPLRVMRDSQGSLWRTLAPGSPQWQWGPETHVDLARVPGLTRAAEFRVRPARDVEGIFTRRVTLPLRDPGVYVVACTGDGLERLNWVMLTDLGLITKRAGGRCLAYAVDLKRGTPVPGAEITHYSEKDERLLGTCGGQGTLSLPAGGAGEGLLVARRGASMAFVRLYGGDDEGGRESRVCLYTDRPVYRPGHHVSFKGIARELQGADLRVPGPDPDPVHVEVRDSRETLIYAGDLTPNDFGSFHGEFDLSPEVATGLCTLAVEMGGKQHQHRFSVAAYRKPEYRVDVRPEQPSYTRGEPAWVTVEARYFFGAPVAGAKVEYTVLRTPLWGWEDDEDLYPYGEESGEGEAVATGEARTDERGQCRFRFETNVEAAPVEKVAGDDPAEEHDYRYSIEATITDEGEFAADGSAQVKVFRGELAVQVAAGGYVAAPGQQVPVTATIRDREGKPRASVPVELSLVRHDWESGDLTVTTTGRATATTDAAGLAKASFRPPRDGSYRVVALVRDDRRNRIRAADYLWVTDSAGAMAGASLPDLQVVADKKEYRPGETATFLINTSKPGPTALVSMEADTLLDHRLVPLTQRSTRITVPITRAHVPNFDLNVCLVHNKEFVTREIPVSVSRRPDALRVEVSADRETYRPGDPSTWRIRTLDGAGRPVAAEVSLGVVDESIYSIAEDHTDILAAFYPKRYSGVDTDFSFPQIYLSGPDKSGPAENVRKDFPDTALWLPAIRTDADGMATVNLRIPDSLTTWRATARAHTRDTHAGQTVARVVCRKELMVRLQAPRFFTARDTATVSALVHNESGAEQRVRLALTTEGIAVERRPGSEQRLAPGQVARFDWQVQADRSGECRLVASARAGGGLSDAVELRLPVRPHGRARTETRSGALSDTVTAEEKLVLRPDAVGETTVSVQMAPSVATGMLSALHYLAGYPYGCTEQTMSRLLPTLVVHRALSELGLNSPRLRKQVPDMVNAGLMRLYRFQHADGGWGWWEFDESDPGMTAYVVEGLVEARDAGFAVNARALEQGVRWLQANRNPTVQPDASSPGPVSAALAAEAARAKPMAPERAQVLLALARAGHGEAFTQAAVDYRVSIAATRDAAVLATLCRAAQRAGRPEDAGRLLDRLNRSARESDALCHWEQDPEATALALQALIAARPKDERTWKVARWLLARRDGDHWVSTRATARVLFALVDYLAASGAKDPDYTVTPVINGQALNPVRFTRESVFKTETRIEIPRDRIRPGENRLVLRKEGPGSLYYTVVMRQFNGQEDLPVLVSESRISVRRTYHLLKPTRSPRTGELRLEPSERPVTRFQAGETYLGRITLNAPSAFEHVVVEEPLPAGCEPVDRGRPDPWEWDDWWTDVDVRDDQVAFFLRRLPAGRQVLEYYLRAAMPGDYHVMPTVVSGMYDPAIRAGGAETQVEVR